MKTTALATVFTLLSAAALAIGSEDDATPPAQTETTETCEDGFVWVAETATCVAIEDVEDDETSPEAAYQSGRELAYYGRHADAITVLSRYERTGDPRILNYLGFAHRRAGNADRALHYYEAALALNPDYLAARSYMGQGFAQQGDIELAMAQLVEIRTRGGRDTYAYHALKAAIVNAGGASAY